ncbi:MAG: DUF2336 domain-containing protein [Alphaproteobacteria bacterium]|nr:DUF2336 domain-containing protein [Rhodospirillales bacterium]MCW9045065.1 DUF2336 domain-containing protein [Alphaproteobacteria bacterium]
MADQSQQTIDSEYLFRLARKKSADSRTALAATISDLFEERQNTLSERERTLMFDILRNVVREVEVKVRQHLSQRLGGFTDAPIELIEILANDSIEVAYPVLTKSMVLRDAHLIEIIRNRTLEHQLAVAIRENITEDVAQELVDTGETGVIATLLKNPSANISQATMQYVVAKSKNENSFQEPLLHRRNLTPEMAEQMFLWVSAALRQYILKNFSLDQMKIDNLLEQVALEEIGQDSVTGGEEASAKTLSQELEKEGLLEPNMLLTALRDGEVPLFVSMFCRMTKLRETLAMRVLFEPGGEGLAIACKAIGIDRFTFTEIFSQTRKARAGGQIAKKSDIENILSLYKRMKKESAEKVLRQWQRNTDYLAAIRQIELDN